MKVLSSAIVSIGIFYTLNAQNITYIDLEKAKFEEINIEKIAEDLELVPLETHPDALLKIRETTYYLTDKYIIAANHYTRSYLFDKETGAFVREVSSKGQGPDEYQGWIYERCGFDEDHHILFADDGAYRGGVWKGINIETNKVETIIKKPSSGDDKKGFQVYAPWLIKDNIYAGYCNNSTGKDKTRLVVFDREGIVMKEYPNYLEYDKTGISSPFNNGIFYYYNGQTYFKEWNYNDTVFCVTEKEMSPHIIFRLGDRQPSYYHRYDADYNKGKYLINFVCESDAYVLFSFLYYTETRRIGNIKDIKSAFFHTGYYDKKKRQAYISSTPDLGKSGYVVSGIPVCIVPVSINKNREMTAMIDPEELIKYKDSIAPKYKHILQDLQEDDNPIIIIAKLKD
jgi:hypothetical protein